MPETSSNRGLMIVLAYLWPLAIVPLLVEKDPDVRWHAKHGLVLMAAEIAALVALMVTIGVITLLMFGVGVVLSLFVVFAWIAIVGLHLAEILRALNGGRLIVPGISRLADRL